MRVSGGLVAAAAAMMLVGSLAWAHSDDDQRSAGDHHHDVIEQMRDLHRDHDHEHDFQAIERMEPDQMRRIMDAMLEIGLAMRPMDPARGRAVFVEKGCIVCHSVSGIGGEVGPALNAEDMPKPMNAFEFAARMWRGAEAMVMMQQQLFGEQTQITGQELADIIAFAHSEAEQEKLTVEAIPERFRAMIPE